MVNSFSLFPRPRPRPAVAMRRRSGVARDQWDVSNYFPSQKAVSAAPLFFQAWFALLGNFFLKGAKLSKATTYAHLPYPTPQNLGVHEYNLLYAWDSIYFHVLTYTCLAWFPDGSAICIDLPWRRCWCILSVVSRYSRWSRGPIEARDSLVILDEYFGLWFMAGNFELFSKEPVYTSFPTLSIFYRRQPENVTRVSLKFFKNFPRSVSYRVSLIKHTECTVQSRKIFTRFPIIGFTYCALLF